MLHKFDFVKFYYVHITKIHDFFIVYIVRFANRHVLDTVDQWKSMCTCSSTLRNMIKK